MPQDCPECQRLWREYAAATTTHVGLENKLRSLAGKVVSVGTLGRDIASAAKLRDSVREAIRQHEAIVHGDAANAAESRG